MLTRCAADRMRYNWRGASGRPPARHISALTDAERSALELPEAAGAHVSDTKELINGSTSDGNESPERESAESSAESRRSPAGALWIALLCATALLILALRPLGQAEQVQGHGQHIFIIRNGDKFSSYDPCGGSNESAPCYDQRLMGNNPPLTPCGLQQAEETADWLVDASRAAGGIRRIVSSPFVRCLETALPLAKRLGLSLHVSCSPHDAGAVYQQNRFCHTAVPSLSCAGGTVGGRGACSRRPLPTAQRGTRARARASSRGDRGPLRADVRRAAGAHAGR